VIVNGDVSERAGDPPRTASGTTSSAAVAALVRLSRREREVFLLVAQGLTVPQIAARLSVAQKTADSLKYGMMRKLELHTRVEVARLAIRIGLLEA